MIPLYKKDDKLTMNNYRPISWLTSISKLFEKVAFEQLSDYFSINNYFHDGQYGFRERHSTKLATIELSYFSFEWQISPHIDFHESLQGFRYLRPRYFTGEIALLRYKRNIARLVPKLPVKSKTVCWDQQREIFLIRHQDRGATGVYPWSPLILDIHERHTECQPTI